MSTSKILCLVLGVLSLFVSGCAISRSVVSVPVNQVNNPEQGTMVVITDVKDMRHFEAEPTDPAKPSLKGAEIADKSITSRAFARKRNAYGMAIGDVVLSEGESVSALVKRGLTNVLRTKGYRVQDDARQGISEGSIPLEVGIKQFWCWMEPGFWYVTSNFKGELELRGNIFKSTDKEIIQTRTDKGHQFITEDDWIATAQGGLDALMIQFTEKLK